MMMKMQTYEHRNGLIFAQVNDLYFNLGPAIKDISMFLLWKIVAKIRASYVDCLFV